MLTGSVIIYALCTSIFAILACFFVGRFSLNVINLICKNSKQIDLFWELFVGLCMITSIVAIIYTKGITILLFVPVFLLILLKYLPSRKLKPNLLFIFSAFIFQFFFFLYSFYSADKEILRYLAGDFNIYFRMAQRLISHGVESYNFSFDVQGYTLPTVYHFGDLWIYAGFSVMNKHNPTASIIAAFSTLSLIFTIGIYNYIHNVFPDFKKKNLLYLLIGAGLFAGIKTLMPAFILKYAEPYTLSIFNWGKVLLLSCSVVALLQLVDEKKCNKAFILLLAISGLLYINAIPAILGAYYLLNLFNWLNKKINFTNLIKNIIQPLFLILIPVVLQYKVFPSIFGLKDNFELSIHKVSFLTNLTGLQYLKTCVNIFVGGWLQLITISPFLVLALLVAYLTKSISNVKSVIAQLPISIYYIIAMFVAGLFSWALTYPLRVDTVQFFHNILAPLYAIIIAILLYYIIHNSKKVWIPLTTFAFVIWGTYMSTQNIFYVAEFSAKDWNLLSAFLDKTQKGSRFISIESDERLNTAFLRKSDQYVPLNILIYKYPNYTNVSLNTPFLKIDSSSLYYHEAYNDIQTSSFAKYIAEAKLVEPNIGIAKLTKNYIDKNDIIYFSLGENAQMPAYIYTFVTDSCYLPHNKMHIYQLTP